MKLKSLAGDSRSGAFQTAEQQSLVPKLGLGTHLSAKLGFAPPTGNGVSQTMSFPNRIWERGSNSNRRSQREQRFLEISVASVCSCKLR